MSRGPGRIERAIEAILDAEPGLAFTTDELAQRVYEADPVEKKHRVVVLNAMTRLAERRDTLGYARPERASHPLIWLNLLSRDSYVMATAKRALGPTATPEEIRERSAVVAASKDFSPGGSKDRNLYFWCEAIMAQRSGDVERLAAIRAEEKAYRDRAGRLLSQRRT